MNIKTMLAAAAIVASTVASADAMKWQITINTGSLPSSITYTENGQSGTINPQNWNAIKMWNNASNSYLDKAEDGNYYFNWGEWGGMSYTPGVLKFVIYDNSGETDQWGDGTWLGDTGSKGGNGNDKYYGTIYWNDVLGEIAKNGSYKGKFFSYNSTTMDDAFTLTRVIPEPTSGLLLLIGAGMLALRRKAVRA